ncbi:MAG: hypothetical protein JWN48_3244 [Myxococcaceae bacterium]|nr:hypothetical protein [Myxococcaceae bacterium]
MAVLSALACLALAAGRDARTLSLHEFAELTHTESVLMSCAESASSSSPLSSGSELQWCADPSSPHCRPAAPPAPRLELWDNPQLTLLSSVQPAPATFIWLPWPRPEVQPVLTRTAAERLDRPPRA